MSSKTNQREASVEEIALKEEKKKSVSDSTFAHRILVPAAILFVIGILFPMVTAFLISFRNSSGGNYFGDHFTRLNYYNLIRYEWVRSDRFWQYTWQTLIFTFGAVFFEFWLGLMFAIILNKKFKGRGIARATLLIPWALPTVASSTIFRFEFFAHAESFGFINSLIQMSGGRTVSFFGADAPILFTMALPRLTETGVGLIDIEVTMTMITAIIVDIWKTTPFLSLLILAALQVVPKDLLKAGDIAGASGWQKFWKIQWPLIKPGVGIGLLFRIVDAVRVYGAVIVFNDSSIYSMTVQAVQLRQITEYGSSSAVAVIEFLIIILFAVVILGLTRKKKDGGKKKKAIEETETAKIGLEDENTSENDQEESKKDLSMAANQPKVKALSEAQIKWIDARRNLKKIGFALLVILMSVWCAGPFLWILLRSFRNPLNSYAQESFEVFPKFFSLESYRIIFQESASFEVTFARALLNGFILSSITALIVLLIASLTGYAFAKFNFKFKNYLIFLVFSMTALPPIIIAVPYFIQIKALAQISPALDLHNKLLGLVLPYTALNLPLAVFVLRSFFEEIPEDLWKAAKVDGASRMQIFWKVILPLTLPGLFTCFILVFIKSWNELLFAQIWLTSDVNHTVPRAILRFVQNPQSLAANWNPNLVILGATAVATLPLVIVVLIFQKKIISGITSGAVKG